MTPTLRDRREGFTKVTGVAGKKAVGKSIQLYMVPGMGHSAGGTGTDTFDKMAAIEQWVKIGTAPDAIVASHRTAGVASHRRRRLFPTNLGHGMNLTNMASPMPASWNPIAGWLKQIDSLRHAA